MSHNKDINVVSTVLYTSLRLTLMGKKIKLRALLLHNTNIWKNRSDLIFIIRWTLQDIYSQVQTMSNHAGCWKIVLPSLL